MTSQNGHGFDEWLRVQLKTRKMSQRQLALQAGVDHSTISRLIRGDRVPSLGTATKLARGLREIHSDADGPRYLGLVTADAANPTARVEYALRGDDSLSEAQVRRIMEYYLAVRRQTFGIAPRPANGNGQANGNGDSNATGQPNGAGRVQSGSASGANGTGRPSYGPVPVTVGPAPQTPQGRGSSRSRGMTPRRG